MDRTRHGRDPRRTGPIGWLARVATLTVGVIAGLAAAAQETARDTTGQAAATPPADYMLPLPEAEARDFLAVGRINRAGFRTLGGCTGTLIRRDVVLTAGHCAGPDTGHTHVFVTGWRRGEYREAAAIAEARRHPAYGIGTRHDPRFDLGLLFLTEPMKEVDPLPLTDALSRAPTGTAALVGYHSRTPHLMTGRLDCPLQRQTDRLSVFVCPVVSGNSGGPVLVPDGSGGWAVAGVVSSRVETEGGLKGAIAVHDLGWVRDILARRDVTD